LGVDSRTIQGVKVPDKPVTPNLTRSRGDILREMGMLDDPLLAVDAPEAEPAQAAQASPAGADSSQPVAIAPAPAGQFIDISLIDPSPFQPRLEFTDEDIAALADTILYQGGLLNPIIVRAKADGRYELIAG